MLQSDSYEHAQSLVAHSIKAIGPSKDSIIEAIEIVDGDCAKVYPP